MNWYTKLAYMMTLYHIGERWQAVYGVDCLGSPRLFTELGAELPSADFIVPMQSLVISGGEQFVPVLLATKMVSVWIFY